MKPAAILQKFEQIAEALGIRVLKEKENYCLLEDKRIIVVNNLKSIKQNIRALAQAFARLDTSQIYLKPAIR